MVLNQDTSIKLLNTIDEKTKLLANFGIDTLIIHPFDETFSKLTAEDFVKTILVEKLNIHKIIIGYDHQFGHDRQGNLAFLRSYEAKGCFEVKEIPVEQIDEVLLFFKFGVRKDIFKLGGFAEKKTHDIYGIGARGHNWTQ